MKRARNNEFQASDDVIPAGLIERLLRPDENPTQFLVNLLAVQCFLGQAGAGAILSGSQERRVDVLAVYPQFEKGATAPEWLVQSAKFAQEVRTAGGVMIRPLKQTSVHDQSVQNYLVMIPLRMADLGEAVAAFLIGTDDKAVLEASSQRLQLVVSMLCYSEARLTQLTGQSRLIRLRQAMEILSALNQQDKFTSATMTFCNEVASQWQCERVSLGFLEGRYVQLKAMSHTEDFSRKMKVVQDIESAMEECLDQDIEVISPASDDTTYIRRAADELSQKYGSQRVLSLPLRREGGVIAVLTLERPADKAFSIDEIETIRLTCELCTARLKNLYEYNRWIGATIAIKTRNFFAEFLGPKDTLAKVLTISFFIAILFIVFVKGQFRAEAPFVLETIQQQVIPAPFDGYIKSVVVEVGDNIEGENSILATLDTAELRLQLAAAKAEKAGYLKQSSAAMRDNETAQAQIAQANADKAQAQIDLLNYQIAQANLISPISGIVQISDEEETRFQMPVSIYGKEKGRHNGGVSYRWGEKVLTLRRGVHLRMANIGASSLIEQRQQLGYPVCSICGQSVSPLASDRQIEHFEKGHEERCGRKPERLGFFADIVADCITIPACADRTEAYSILEVLRFAAAQVLDMHVQDLQILVIGYVDRDEVDGLLWDPMPGGSGLLDQIYENFVKIVAAAIDIADGCPNACEHSCIDCLQMFRNAYYHRYLDRHIALEQIKELGDTLKAEHNIPPLQPTPQSQNLDDQPTNDGETKLKHLLKAAGFMDGEFQQQIRFKEPIVLTHQIGSTTPDVYYAGDEDDEDDNGVGIYLDGMSSSLHGNRETAEKDREIRSWLRSNGYHVIEITYVELDDRNAMVRHFKKLAKYLSGKELAKKITKDKKWFDKAGKDD